MQLLFVALLILPFFVIALLVMLFVVMVIRDIIGGVLAGFGLSSDAGSHQFGVDPGGAALIVLLGWRACGWAWCQACGAGIGLTLR